MDLQSTRYAPMNHAYIYSFPNCLPHIDWQANLQKFKDEKGDDVALHLVKFHMHSHKLGVELYEDCLMKMFMVSLEGKSKYWYEKLSLRILYSLKYFHLVFFEISFFITG